MTAPGRLIAVATGACRAAQASPGYRPGDRVFISLAAGSDAAWYARGYPEPAGDVLVRDLAANMDVVVFREDFRLGDMAWSSRYDGGSAVPPDRLTRVCAAAGDVLERHTAASDRAIIAVAAPPGGRDPGRRGMCLAGYASAAGEIEMRQQVAWDLAGHVCAILGLRRPRPVPGTWPAPPSLRSGAAAAELAALAAHPGCRLPGHRPGCPDWRP